MPTSVTSHSSKGFTTNSYLKVHKGTLRAIGDLNVAATLAVLQGLRDSLLRLDRLPPDGSFYIQQRRIAWELCLKREATVSGYCQRLAELGLISIAYRGMPRRAYYTLHDDRYDELNRSGTEQQRGVDLELLDSQQNIKETDPVSHTPNGGASHTPNVGLGIRQTHPVVRGREKTVSELPLEVHGAFQAPDSTRVKSPTTRPARRHLLPVVPLDPYEHLTDSMDVKFKSSPKPVRVTAAVAPIVSRWAEVGITHGPTTQALRRGVRAARAVLDGTFFLDKGPYRQEARPFSAQEVLRALETFNLKRNSVDHLPVDKTFLRKIGLADFFYSPYVRNGHGDGGGSLFLECLKTNGVAPAVERNPELAAYVIEKYEGATAKVLSAEAAARVANKLTRYWGEREPWLKARGVATPKRLVVSWFKMLEGRHGAEWDAGSILSANMNTVYENFVKTHSGGR